jgi:hypothetical protein
MYHCFGKWGILYFIFLGKTLNGTVLGIFRGGPLKKNNLPHFPNQRYINSYSFLNCSNLKRNRTLTNKISYIHIEETKAVKRSAQDHQNGGGGIAT